MKTPADLVALTRQRTWDKDVVLWSGSEKALMEALGEVPHTVLDLLDLFDEDHLPMDEEETRAQLIGNLRKRLRSMDTAPESRTVLIVKSIGLLTRYRAGVKEFYDWFCGDFTMVVLVLEGPMEDCLWPEDVICDSDRLIDSFQAPVVVKQVFWERG
jgi:hypothetical protein